MTFIFNVNNELVSVDADNVNEAITTIAEQITIEVIESIGTVDRHLSAEFTPDMIPADIPSKINLSKSNEAADVHGYTRFMIVVRIKPIPINSSISPAKHAFLDLYINDNEIADCKDGDEYSNRSKLQAIIKSIACIASIDSDINIVDLLLIKSEGAYNSVKNLRYAVAYTNIQHLASTKNSDIRSFLNVGKANANAIKNGTFTKAIDLKKASAFDWNNVD